MNHRSSTISQKHNIYLTTTTAHNQQTTWRPDTKATSVLAPSQEGARDTGQIPPLGRKPPRATKVEAKVKTKGTGKHVPFKTTEPHTSTGYQRHLDQDHHDQGHSTGHHNEDKSISISISTSKPQQAHQATTTAYMAIIKRGRQDNHKRQLLATKEVSPTKVNNTIK